MDSVPYKYPRTPHLPWSPGIDADDVLAELATFEGREVVVTEKMDGENTNMYPDMIHARSMDSRHHPSRDWVKAYWGGLRYHIPTGWRICGENVYAEHSLKYDALESYFYGFAMYNGFNTCLNWDYTLQYFKELGITPVPTLYRGKFDVKELKKLAMSLDLTRQEGYVVRVVEEFPFEPVLTLSAKFVRKGHVQTDEHWMKKPVVPNKLKHRS